MNETDFRELVDRYVTGALTAAERASLQELLEKEEYLQMLGRHMQQSFDGSWYEGDAVPQIGQSIQRWLAQRIAEERPAKIKTMRPWRWVAAACILIGIVAGGLLVMNRKPGVLPPAVAQQKDVKAPATNHATITLSDGKVLYLDSAATGTLTTTAGVRVEKLGDGKLAYSGNTSEISYNTLNNPRGSRVIDITLSDGSRVWLNAGSSITYPVAFAGGDRKVTVDGEAYFEVAHDARKPFIVSKGTVSVQVLGTHFNVNAYSDEPEIKVTLLEGSVKVSEADHSTLIKPGEQASITDNISVAGDVDLDKVMAWKDGWFEFSNLELGSIMRQVGRWYALDIHYEGKPGEEKFAGRINRNLPLSKVLEMLESSGNVKFTLNGRQLTVR